MKLALAALMVFTPISAFADVNNRSFQPGFSEDRTCLKTEYREEYVPGTRDNPGYIKTYNETFEVPCDDTTSSTRRIYRETTVEYDTNDCSQGTIAGGLLGGGAAAALSQGNGRWWAVPLGIVGGAMIGCDINGG